MNNLMLAGLELMLVGMGTVFVFLTLLVGATTLMSRIVVRIAPPRPTVTPGTGGPSEEELVAISAAINLHRTKQG